ncbi:G-protein coupled receptor moody-like [Asterias rubens]|uniref:G-protein coupled receptor moody-like n=1 Tax=Asterias rubens TaxID=7604 RepID=UPI0014559083|nr:G-protein coupled receptor moody-like [Asterias rubens]
METETSTNITDEFLTSSKTLYPYPELVFCATGFAILSVTALVGNSIVLIAVARHRKLQNATNVFVVNLSVTDCLTGFAFLWSIPGMVSRTPGYPLPFAFPCVASAAIVFSTVGCSMYTLANIAINRLVLITQPMETYRSVYTPKKIAVMVFISWLIPTTGIVLPPLLGIGDVGFDIESRTCSDIDGHPKAGLYDKIQFATLYPVPFLVIIIAYVLILKHVRRHFKKTRRAFTPKSSMVIASAPASSATRLDDDGPTPAPRSGTSLNHAESIRKLSLNRTRNDQLEITKNLFVVVCALVVCFTPLSIMVVTKNNRYQLYGGLALFVSSCINPLIYATKHPHFKPVLRSMLRCR